MKISTATDLTIQNGRDDKHEVLYTVAPTRSPLKMPTINNSSFRQKLSSSLIPLITMGEGKL
jgi:hypothetical protein